MTHFSNYMENVLYEGTIKNSKGTFLFVIGFLMVIPIFATVMTDEWDLAQIFMIACGGCFFLWWFVNRKSKMPYQITKENDQLVLTMVDDQGPLKFQIAKFDYWYWSEYRGKMGLYEELALVIHNEKGDHHTFRTMWNQKGIPAGWQKRDRKPTDDIIFFDVDDIVALVKCLNANRTYTFVA